MSPHISSQRSRKDRRSRSRHRHRSRSHRREYREKKDRSRHESERTHHDQVDGSQQRIRSPSSPAYSSSTSRESDFAKLTAVLSGIVSTGSKRSTYVNEKILPDFYPALIRQFPGKESFGKLMEDAFIFKSTPGQDLQTYCFAKLGKINKLKLELPEEKLVDLIALGIHDESIRTIFLAARCKTVADLNKCLSVFPNLVKIKETRDPKVAKDFKRPFSNNPGSDKSKNFLNDGCFKCGKKGHVKKFCPESLEGDILKVQTDGISKNKGEFYKSDQKKESIKKKCTFCNYKGHTEDQCYKKKNKKRKDRSE